jgi:DNA-binding GntR family transcriptional regulator
MTIVNTSLARRTYEMLRQRILTGEIAPNAPVRQDAIAEELGVSTIPIREALSLLEQDGLLSSYPNRGYIVRPLSAAEATEVFALRLKLEPGVAAEGSRKATPEDHLAASNALAALEAAPSDGTLGDRVTANRLFHIALIRPGTGLVTLQILDRLHVLAERYVRVHLEPTGRDVRARREHRDLLSAWKAGDYSATEALMFNHIRATVEDLQKQLAA